MITIIYHLVISAAIGTAAFLLVQSHKDAKEHILRASELRQAALSYVGEHCSDQSLATNVNPKKLITEGHLAPSFNDHGIWIRMRLADYPHSTLVTRDADNSPFRVFLNSLDMGQRGGPKRRKNRFSPDTGAHRVATGGLNLMLVDGYEPSCEAPAERAELWDNLCAGLKTENGIAAENDGMTCNDWSE